MPACRYCKEPGAIERASTTDGRTVATDCCYGCRNRHFEARRMLEDASGLLNAARILLEAEQKDDQGNKAADGLAALDLDLTALRRELDQ